MRRVARRPPFSVALVLDLFEAASLSGLFSWVSGRGALGLVVIS